MVEPACQRILENGLIERYVAQQLSDDDREALESHLLTCDQCQLEIRLAAAIRDAIAHSRAGDPREATEQQRPSLAVISATPVPRRTLKRVAAVALAAAAVVVLILARSSSEPQPPEPRFREPTPSAGAAMHVSSPADGATLLSDSVRLAWQPVAPDAHYSLTLTDEHGQVVWRHTLRDTLTGLPRDVSLAGGSRYYWFVDALLPDGRSATTGVHEFRIAP